MTRRKVCTFLPVLLLATIAASTTAQEVDWPILVTPGYQAAPRQEVYFSWLPVDGAIEYQLQVDVDANFSSPGIDQVTGWTHWCAGGFTVLEYNYWRVRARLATGWASWSARWVFNPRENGPRLLYPNWWEPDVKQPVSFRWGAMDGATEYQLQVDDNADFSSPGIDLVTGWTHWCAGGFTEGSINHWRVRAFEGCGFWGPWNSGDSFTVHEYASLPTPELVTPYQGQVVRTYPGFTWNAGFGGTIGLIQINTYESFIAPKFEATTYGQFITGFLLDVSTEYFWRVKTSNACEESDWSDVRSFWTEDYQQYSVTFESKTVHRGEENVALRIFGTWMFGLAYIHIPIVVRSVDGGAFWTGQLPFDSSTIAGGTHGVNWNWVNQDFADQTRAVIPGVPGFPCDPGADIGYDGNTPDHLYIVALQNHSTQTEPEHLDDWNFLTLTFDVNLQAGSFEFDTACHNADLIGLRIVDANGFSHGSGIFDGSGCFGCKNDCYFTKGVVTISECECGAWGDVNGDGAVNPVDVVFMVNYVYKGQDARIQPQDCLYEAGDADCSQQVNPVDVVYFVNYVYKNQNAFCDPCLD